MSLKLPVFLHHRFFFGAKYAIRCITYLHHMCQFKTFMSDLKRNDVVSPWPETVCIQIPDLVEDLTELLTGLLTGRGEGGALLSELTAITFVRSDRR